MYNDTLSPLFPLSLDNGNTSDPLAGIRCTGKNKDPASVVGPMRKPVDPIFDNTRASQDSHLVFESPNLLNVPTIYSLYAVGHTPVLSPHLFISRYRTRTLNIVCSSVPMNLFIGIRVDPRFSILFLRWPTQGPMRSQSACLMKWDSNQFRR